MTLLGRDGRDSGRRVVFRLGRRETHVTGTHVATADQEVHQHAVGGTLFGRLLLTAPFPRRRRRGRCGVRPGPLDAAAVGPGASRRRRPVAVRVFLFLLLLLLLPLLLRLSQRVVMVVTVICETERQ